MKRVAVLVGVLTTCCACGGSAGPSAAPSVTPSPSPSVAPSIAVSSPAPIAIKTTSGKAIIANAFDKTNVLIGCDSFQLAAKAIAANDGETTTISGSLATAYKSFAAVTHDQYAHLFARTAVVAQAHPTEALPAIRSAVSACKRHYGWKPE